MKCSVLRWPYLVVVLSYFTLHFETWYLATHLKPCSWVSNCDYPTREVEPCTGLWLASHSSFLTTGPFFGPCSTQTEFSTLTAARHSLGHLNSHLVPPAKGAVLIVTYLTSSKDIIWIENSMSPKFESHCTEPSLFILSTTVCVLPHFNFF